MLRLASRFFVYAPFAFLVVLVLAGSSLLSATQKPNKPPTSKPQLPVKKPLIIAHRGASGYAPEHTLAAYQLAIEQGADFVEQDLQITKDGRLVCIHDPELSRTTNVKEVFPDRTTKRDVEGAGEMKPGYYVADFTLEELKRLDAGSWFNKYNPFSAKDSYVGQKIPTLEETIKFVNNRAGLYIELKDFDYHQRLGYDMAKMVADVLKANGYATPKMANRIYIQSFSKEGLLKMRDLAPQYARIQLLPMEDRRRKDTDKVTEKLAKEIAEYAQGVGPAKKMIASATEAETLHKEGLLIHPYTFRGTTNPITRSALDALLPQSTQTERQVIIEDIKTFLAYGIDGGFTDYPAVWKEALMVKK
jgi:alkaline phosphatase D